MKKIGIMTLHGLYNYGNRLQNYAVQEQLAERGYQAESIICARSRFRRLAYLGYVCVNIIRGKDSMRMFNFHKYEKKYMKDRFIYDRNKKIPNSINNDYDAFVVGSDQVWNPELRKDERANFFLQFAAKDKRIALAPSISVDAILPELRECFVDGWAGFNELSVRESQGAKIIKELTGRTAQVLVDPTLALNKNKWDELADEYKINSEPYLLTYYLGKISPETLQLIDRIAESNKLKVIILNDLKNKKLHSIDPQAFLAYIKHSTVVFTDSFHGCVFSTLFHRPFVASIRMNDNKESAGIESRLYSLLTMLRLEDRFEADCPENKIMDIDFTECDVVIEEKRIEFNSFLDRQLERIGTK